MEARQASGAMSTPHGRRRRQTIDGRPDPHAPEHVDRSGLRALAAGRPDAVRVEPLAKALGVTRGGFYWHFADRRALLDEMLDTWERATIDEVIERVEGQGGDPRGQAPAPVRAHVPRGGRG